MLAAVAAYVVGSHGISKVLAAVAASVVGSHGIVKVSAAVAATVVGNHGALAILKFCTTSSRRIKRHLRVELLPKIACYFIHNSTRK